MTNFEGDLRQRPKVFISYSNLDSAAAKAIVEGLRAKNLDVDLDADEFCPGDLWTESIRAEIEASSYFLLLLSEHSIRSPWVNQEIESVLKELQSRDVTFLPVLLEDCIIPPSLATYQYFDMRSGVEENLDKLAEALRATPDINFAKLSPGVFEQLVADLLQKLGFTNSQSAVQHSETGIDAVVEFRQKDPFGAETREIYIVETKLYHHSRADLQALRQLAGYAKSDPKIDKALLVTNGNLTSVALDWVSDAPRITGIPIRVIDGTELKRLLLKNTDLVSKYFSTSLSNAS